MKDSLYCCKKMQNKKLKPNICVASKRAKQRWNIITCKICICSFLFKLYVNRLLTKNSLKTGPRPVCLQRLKTRPLTWEEKLWCFLILWTVLGPYALGKHNILMICGHRGAGSQERRRPISAFKMCCSLCALSASACRFLLCWMYSG